MKVPKEWYPPRERLLLPVSKQQQIFILLGCGLAAVVCPIAYFNHWGDSSPLHKNPMWLIVGMLCFGSGAIWAALQLLPNASWIALSKEGLEIRSSFRSNLVPWSQMENFRWGVITGLGSFGYLGFDLKDPAYFKGYISAALRPDLVQQANALLAWKSFGLPPEELGPLLTAWQKEYGAPK